MTFQFIRDHREHFPVRLMWRVLEASPSGFYDWLGGARSPRGGRGWVWGEENPGARGSRRRGPTDLRQPAGARQPGSRCGAATAAAQGKAAGYRIGRKRVARLMREDDIRAKRKFKVTTDSRHDHPVAPNLLDRQFTVEAPNTVWLADISYIWTREGWLYLAVVLDLFSRQVVGWAMDEQMPQELTLTALDMALK